ncbi:MULTISPECIES: hypothetical protein [Moorena]|nr:MULTISPECIES: hypothetical protein [Moorena]
MNRGALGRWGDGQRVDRLFHKWIDRWSRYGNDWPLAKLRD